MQAPTHERARALVEGTFSSVEEAEGALRQLRARGLGSNDFSVQKAGQAAGEESVDSPISLVKGSALVGAVALGLVGLVVGWITRANSFQPPQNTTQDGLGVLATAAVGLLGGAALGALGGAIFALFGREMPAEKEEGDREQEELIVTVSAVENERVWTEAVLRSNGGFNVRSHVQPDQRDVPEQAAGQVPAIEEDQMNEKSGGVNPDNVTGTQDSIDPVTGALGTAGTPVTTGYGVSGSTAGTGTAAGREAYEQGDEVGETPDSYAYDAGGRNSGDAQNPLAGSSSDESVSTKYTTERSTSGEIDQSDNARDVYESGAANTTDTDTSAHTDMTELYSDVDVESPPTQARMDPGSPQGSGGTDIPGTDDYRGLGDNTDDQS